ncbi:MAG: hypothetical protein QXQ02_03785 [Halobacteria archaeon]
MNIEYILNVIGLVHLIFAIIVAFLLLAMVNIFMTYEKEIVQSLLFLKYDYVKRAFSFLAIAAILYVADAIFKYFIEEGVIKQISSYIISMFIGLFFLIFSYILYTTLRK